MKISLVILTFNRAEIVRKAVSHNLQNAGREVDELVWVDNGSKDNVCEVMQLFNPHVSVLHKENLGVAKGYNRGFALSTGDFIVITGCDMLMPDNWLATFEKYFTKIPETDVAAMYSQPFQNVRERLRGEMQERNGLKYQHAMPMGRRMMRRSTLYKAGFLREDFALYGWEDVEWAERCLAKGLFCYAIPDQVAEHIGTEAIRGSGGQDDPVYVAFKREQLSKPQNAEVMAKCRNGGYPIYNPYAGLF